MSLAQPTVSGRAFLRSPASGPKTSGVALRARGASDPAGIGGCRKAEDSRRAADLKVDGGLDGLGDGLSGSGPRGHPALLARRGPRSRGRTSTADGARWLHLWRKPRPKPAPMPPRRASLFRTQWGLPMQWQPGFLGLSRGGVPRILRRPPLRSSGDPPSPGHGAALCRLGGSLWPIAPGLDRGLWGSPAEPLARSRALPSRPSERAECGVFYPGRDARPALVERWRPRTVSRCAAAPKRRRTGVEVDVSGARAPRGDQRDERLRRGAKVGSRGFRGVNQRAVSSPVSYSP